MFSLSGINAKHSYKVFTVKVKPALNPVSLNHSSLRYTASSGALLLPPLRVTERGVIYSRETNSPIYADGTLAASQQIQWLYQPGEITPTARYQQGKLHYVVTDHQGTPREIFSEGGQASWAGRLNTWGQMQFWRYREGKAENDPNYTECPFRFAGQYEDEESGFIIASVIMIRKQGSIFPQTQ